MKYQQIVPTIDAVTWTGDNLEEVNVLVGAECTVGEGSVTPGSDPIPDCLFVPSGMGTMTVPPGNLVTKDQYGNVGYSNEESFLTVWEPAAVA